MSNPIHNFSKNMKMRTKIFAVSIITVSIFMGLSLYQSLATHKNAIMKQASEFSNHMLDNIYSGIRFPMSIGDEKTVKEQMKDVKKEMEGVEVYISDFKNNITYASENERVNTGIENYLHEKGSKALAGALNTGKVREISLSGKKGEDPFLITIKPLFNEPSCYHCHGSSKKILGSMVIKQPLKNLFTAINNTRNRLIIYFATALIGLVVFINFFFSRIVTRRIQALKEKTCRVAAGDVTVEEFTDDSRDSIGSLARNFNKMVKSIRDRMEYANSLKLGIIDPFFMVDPEMNITFINENATRLSGMSADEAIGKPCYEVFHTSICDNECSVKKAMESNENAESRRMVITGPDGNEITAMSISSILKDSSGNTLGAFKIIRDLSAEVKAEKNLQEAYLREGKAKKDLEKKVDDLSEILKHVARGDFSMRGELSGKEDAMDIMIKRINEAIGSIVNLISQVKNHIIPVIKGVGQISEGNRNLSQRTQQQASAMEEINVTLEELVSTTNENLATTRHADSLSKDAVKVAEEGGKEVEKTSYAMVEMSNASKKIVEMVELINEITFQTNLLSVNAAIEAARVGEHGHGFAVVAGEIRNLAKKSGNASRDIQKLVHEIMTKVDTAGQWVNDLKGSFTRIVQTSKQVSDALGDVSIGNEESSKGIEQISKGTQELSDVNEKNAYFVEEIAQETQRLAKKAQELHNMVGLFILGDREMEQEKEEFLINENQSMPAGKERRKSRSSSTLSHKDLLSKTPVDDMDKDLLEKEFEGGFEEF